MENRGKKTVEKSFIRKYFTMYTIFWEPLKKISEAKKKLEKIHLSIIQI